MDCRWIEISKTESISFECLSYNEGSPLKKIGNIFCLQYIAIRMVYCVLRIVSFCIAIYCHTRYYRPPLVSTHRMSRRQGPEGRPGPGQADKVG